jgi:threonine aldolase
MRQGGFIAAAGIYALQNNINRLVHDHEHAKQIADALLEKDFVLDVLPVQTNIIIFSVKPPLTSKMFVEKLKEHNILGYAISPTQVRLVTHLDITEEMVQKTINVIQKSAYVPTN